MSEVSSALREIDGVLNVEMETEPNNMQTIVTYDDKKVTLEQMKKVLQEIDIPFVIEQ
ncbi:MAG: hypothetical protein QMD07_08290 [Thermodesulfovibrionales bacterium]|nr:hypothetical protein [Thermodesulfovibrionales bacterium]